MHHNLSKQTEVNDFLATLTLKKIGNLLKNRASFVWSVIARSGSIAGAPVTLSIEPSACCQLHCPECVLGAGMLKRHNRFIDFELYKKAIEQNKNTLCYLTLYFQGEPLLAPRFFDMVSYAVKSGIFTATSTNAQNIDDVIAEKIVASGLNKLIISLDGVTQQSYERYRKGGKIENVIAAIEKINDEKAKKSVSTPNIELQFIVFRHNENEIGAFKRLAESLKVQKVTVKTAQIYDFQNKENLIPTQQKFSRYTYKNSKWQLRNKQHNFCLRQWQGSVITTDGEVVPCCFDKNAGFSFGRLQNSDFSEIWHGTQAARFRQRILHNRADIEICRNCSE